MSSHRSRILVAGAVLAILAVLVLSRETAVDNLFERVDLAPDTVLTTPRGMPQAQFAVNIDPETNVTRVIDVTPPPPPPAPKPAPRRARWRPFPRAPSKSRGRKRDSSSSASARA